MTAIRHVATAPAIPQPNQGPDKTPIPLRVAMGVGGAAVTVGTLALSRHVLSDFWTEASTGCYSNQTT